MVESTRPVQSRDPFERFDEAINDSRLYDSNQPRLYESSQPRSYESSQPRFESNQPRLYEADHYEQPYALPYERQDTYDRQDTLGDDLPSHEPVPLFLSNYEDEAHQALSEYTFASGSRKKMRTGRIVTGAIAVSAIAALLALFSIDSTRAVIFNASLGGGGSNGSPAQVAAAVPEPTAAPAPVVPQRIAAPPLGAEPSPPPSAAPPSAPDVAAARRNTPADAMASTSPSRDEITAAYQSALKGKVAVPEPVAREAARETAPATVAALAPAVREPVPVTREAAPARRIDPDELAALLKRAKSLLAIGDITSARLLLERAADAQEAEAALMLAGTYDPQVLGSQDMRSVTPDPAAAKLWYQKAAQLGSADARRRLGQLQN